MKKNNIIQFNKDIKKKVLSESSKRGFGLFNEGLYFYNEDKNELAFKKFKEAEAAGYESAEMYADMAWLYGALFEDHEKVKIYAEKSLKLDDEYAFPYSLIGRYYHLVNEDKERALKYYLLADKYDCQVVLMYRAASEIYLDMGDFMNAVKFATKAVSLDTNDSYSYYWKGYVYYKGVQDYKTALKYYKKSECMGQVDCNLYYEMSYCYSMLEEHDKGLEYANKHIFLDKNDCYGYYRKAFAYFQSGDSDNAFEQYKLADKYGCKEADMFLKLGYISCCLKNDLKEAVKWLQKGYKVNKGDVICEYLLAYTSVLYDIHRYKKALEIIEIGLKKFPDAYYLFLMKYNVLNRKKRYPELTKVVRKLKKLELENPCTKLCEAIMYSNRPKETRNYKKVLSLLLKIEDPDNTLEGGHIASLAFTYCELKEYEKCICAFDEFFANPLYTDELAPNLREIKRYFKRVYKRFPNDVRLNDIVKKFPQLL